MLDDPDRGPGDIAEICSSEPSDIGERLLDVMACRQSVPPLRLAEPGPTLEQTERLLTIAVRVPDHGALEPWRIVLVQGSAREKLAARMVAAFAKEKPGQDPAGIDPAIRKIKVLLAAPLVVIVVSRIDPSAKVPQWEQILSAGAVSTPCRPSAMPRPGSPDG
jgi:nitroreductase